MNPKYSVLFCNQNLEKYKDVIARLLYEGIKIIWFGTDKDVQYLNKP